jgi:hypothetical protein
MEPVTNHSSLAQQQLLQQFHNSPNLNALLAAFVNRLQELEDATNGVITGITVANAQGEVLDKLGALVGEARDTSDDDVYRSEILSRAIINRCNGTAEEIDSDGNLVGGILYALKAVEQFTSTSDLIIEGLGSVYLFTDGTIPITLETARILQRSVPAGVAVTVAQTSPYPFLWTEDATPEFIGQGFGEYIPTSVDHIGGIFSEVYIFIDV